MEQGPELYYGERDRRLEDAPQGKTSFEQFLAENPELDSKSSSETRSGSRSFEELVREALEEELRYERDPALRDQASQRADQILAEFQEAKQKQYINDDQAKASKPEKSDQLNHPQKIAKQIGLSTDRLRQAARVKPSVNYGLADFILGTVIAVLLVIVIILLIF